MFLSAVLTAGFVAVDHTTASASHLPTCTTYRDVDTGPSYKYEPSTSGGSLSCVLKRGNENSAVRILQRALRDCNYKSLGPYGVDGSYGYYTEQAVRDEQNDHDGITADGIYGPETRRVMRWVVYSSSGVASCASA